MATPPAASPRRWDRANSFWLAALLGLVTFLMLEPYLSFALFGSDTGEYYRLTDSLIVCGHLVSASQYSGWGFGYPEFPGLFLLAGAAADALRIDPLSSLLFVIPVVLAFTILPLFLLFRRLFSQDTIALVGAAFATVALPRLFAIAHPAPLALGDFLVVAALWMFVESRLDARWYFPLALCGGALIVTHHLSSYFFLLSGLGGLLIVELARPRAWSSRFPLRELAFLGGFAAGLLAYWIDYASVFRVRVIGPAVPDLGLATVPFLVVVATAVVVLVGTAIRFRRSRGARRPLRIGVRSTLSVFRDALLIAIGLGTGVVALLFAPLPGTNSLHATLGDVAFFAPYLAVVPLCAGSRHTITAERLGPFALAWLAALGLSTIFGLVTSNQVLLPARAAEYLIIPVGLLAALGLGRSVASASSQFGRRALVTGGVGFLVLLAANAAVVYPPPADFDGFQEGLTYQDAALWLWAAHRLPPATVVASDHRLSSMLFGFDGFRATWDSTPGLFIGTNWSVAAMELRSSPAPSAPNPVRAVAIDAAMRVGVALDPRSFALPLSSAALAWFGAPLFLPLYENGLQVVYWVSGPPPAFP